MDFNGINSGFVNSRTLSWAGKPNGGPIAAHERIADWNLTRLDRPVTIVTAYYDIPSKRRSHEYFQFMKNFLPTIPCHIYIFTEQKWHRRLNDLRSSFPNRTKIVVKSFDMLEMAKRY